MNGPNTTKCFLQQLDSKVTRLDEKLTQIGMLIEKKKRVEGSVQAFRVPISNTTHDFWNKMEDKIAEIIQTLKKTGKSCVNSSKLINESILRREVEADLPELVKEDVLGSVEDCEESTLQQQLKEKC